MYGRQLYRSVGPARPWRPVDCCGTRSRSLHVSCRRAQDETSSSSLTEQPVKNTTRRSASVAASREVQDLANSSTKPIDLRNLNQSSAELRPLVRRTYSDSPAAAESQMARRSVVRRPTDGDIGARRGSPSHRGSANFGRGDRTQRNSLSQEGGMRSRGRGGVKTRGLRRRDSALRAGSSATDLDEDDQDDEDNVFRTDFGNPEEMQIYIELSAAMEQLAVMETNAKELYDKGGDENISAANQIQENISQGLAYCLIKLAEVKQKWTRPQHAPKELERDHAVGVVGDVPVGQAGMGRVIEDGLRSMVRRKGMEWQDPKDLSTILQDGKFIKFRSHVERADVARLAKYKIMEGEPAAERDGFVPLPKDARVALVQRLVQGEYLDRADEDLKGEVLHNAAKIVNGNSTYLASEKSKLLGKIQSLLPVERMAKRASQRT